MTIWIAPPVPSSRTGFRWSKMIKINKKWWYKLKVLRVLLRKCYFCILTMSRQLILGLKKNFSITIFQKKSLSFLCGTFYIAPKPLKKSICGSLVATKSQNAKWLFEWFRCKIKGATEKAKWFFWKMVILKIFFQTQNQLFWHSQNTKVAFS